MDLSRLSQYDQALLQKRQILFAERLTVEMQERISASVLYLSAINETPITLFIDSQGGEVGCELWVMDQIAGSRVPVHGVVIGSAASAAFGVLQACPRRLAYAHAMLLIHAPRVTVSCDEDNAKLMQDNMRVHDEQITAFAKRSGQPEAEWRTWSKEQKKFLAYEALRLGMLDEIISASWTSPGT
jgi:ATP-dependent Clp protease, protease subunit